MQRISSETAAWKLFRPSLFRRSLASIVSLMRFFFRRRADRFRQKIVEIGAILAFFLLGKHTLSCLGSTHCPVGKHTLSCLENTHCPVWKAHIVLFGHDTLSCLETTHCPVWQPHIVLCGNHTLSSVETTHCLLWKRDIILCGNNTLSSLDTTHCPLWKRHIVLFGNDTFFSVETMKCSNNFFDCVNYRVLFRQPYCSTNSLKNFAVVACFFCLNFVRVTSRTLQSKNRPSQQPEPSSQQLIWLPE